jgi:ActR/RegA family two-component response regulator
MSNPKILLFTSRNTDRWETLVRNAATRLQRSLEVIEDSQVSYVSSWGNIELALMDAGHVGRISDLIRAIRLQRSDLTVVVLSPAPAYEEAKEAVFAGAARYQLKPTNAHDVFHMIERNLPNPKAMDKTHEEL